MERDETREHVAGNPPRGRVGGQDQSLSADLVIKAGAIHSMTALSEQDARVDHAMAVRAGRIVALSSERYGLDDLVGQNTVVLDDPRLTVLPTFDDTHTHLIFAARAVNDVQVADAHSLAELLDLIRARAANTPKGQWIRTASNWHELQLTERRLPHRLELDGAAPNHPRALGRAAQCTHGGTDAPAVSDSRP